MSSSSSPTIETLHAHSAAPLGRPRPQPDFWYARGALSFIIFLQIFLQNGLRPGDGIWPPWTLPLVEMSLLLLLSIASFRDNRAHHRAGRMLEAVTGTSQSIRRLALFLISLITVLNLVSLLILVRALLSAGKASGAELFDDAAILWTTNVICFALCYWELDRGGPSKRETLRQKQPDFLFANMTLPEALSRPWTPRFVDYLFLAFTNASAFSPTDALPLTARAKLIMMVQASVSLLTIAIVAARAVNILA
jgi:hypothetical protein